MSDAKSEILTLQKEIGLLTELLENDEENSALLNERGQKFICLNETANAYFDKTGIADFLGNHLASAMQDFDDALAHASNGTQMAHIHQNYGCAHFLAGRFNAASEHFLLGIDTSGYLLKLEKSKKEV